MRTLGPRSVSSFLKVFLDLAFVVTTLWLVFLGALALLSALQMSAGVHLPNWHWAFSSQPLFASTPRGAAWLLTGCLFTLGLWVIVGRLRKIFVTLIAGQPFQAENARRLRVIGLVLAALEFSRYGVWAIMISGTAIGQNRLFQPQIDFVGLFAIGVMFVLAEVFDEGVRMRKDLDLTI